MTATAPVVRIQIPRLLEHQEVVARHPARFKVPRCGRRWGKDRFAFHVEMTGHGPGELVGKQMVWRCPGPAVCPRAPHHAGEPCFRGLAQGFDVVWVAPDYPQANLMWTEEIRPRFASHDWIRLNEAERTLTLPGGGGTLWVRSAETIDAIRGIGKRLGGVVVNEAAHMDLEYAWRTVIRPALMDNKGWAIIMSTTNSGADGNSLKRVPSYFNVLCQEILDGKRSHEWAHFYGTAHDNPKLDPKEIADLITEYAPDSVPLKEEVFAELLEGGTGLVFNEWRTDLHVVKEDFKVPPHWRWGCGLDWGHAAPGWFGLFAVGPEGDVYCDDELYFKQTHAFEAGRQCALKAVQRPIEYVSADSAMWQKTGIGPTLAEEFQRGWDSAYGGDGRGPRLLEVSKGPGSRAARVQVLHHYLAWKGGKDGKVPPSGLPFLRLHARCANAIRTIPKLPYDPVKTECVDTNAEDHPFDGLTYFLMSRPQRAHRWVAERDREDHPGIDPVTGKRKKKWFEGGLTPAEPQVGFIPRGPMVEIE